MIAPATLTLPLKGGGNTRRLHHAEHVADFPGKRSARYRVPMLRAGRRAWIPCEEFDTSSRVAHPSWPGRFFALIVDDVIARHDGTALCAAGKVGGTDSVLIDGGARHPRAADHGGPSKGRESLRRLSPPGGEPC